MSDEISNGASADLGSRRRVPGKVFISYSHEDAQFLAELLDHLSPLKRAGLVEPWSDLQIAPGSRWLDEIEQSLATASVAVLLVTRSFLASDFINERELNPLLKAAADDGVCILWIPVRACPFQDTPLSKYQAVLSPNKPLAQMGAGRDKAWVEVYNAIKRAAAPPSAKKALTMTEMGTQLDGRIEEAKARSDRLGATIDGSLNDERMLYECLEKIRQGVHPLTALQSQKVYQFRNNDDLVRFCGDLELHGVENPCSMLPVPKDHWLGFLKVSVGRDLGTNEGMLAALDDVQALPHRIGQIRRERNVSDPAGGLDEIVEAIRGKSPLEVVDILEGYCGQQVSASGVLAAMNLLDTMIIAVVRVEHCVPPANVGCQFDRARWKDSLRDYKTGDSISVMGKVSKSQSGQLLHLDECEIRL